jgi:hypothetical protein
MSAVLSGRDRAAALSACLCLPALSAPRENFLYVFKGARSAPRASWRVALHEVACAGGRGHRAARSAGRGAMRPAGILIASGLAAPPLHLRHTAGCRPSVTPDTARRQLAAVTPADLASAGQAILPALQHETGKDHRQERFASHVMPSGHP